MQPRLFFSKEQIPLTLVTVLFALFVIMLPRYTDTAKIWFALLILGATVYLAFNWRQLRQTSKAERIFFAVLVGNFAWIAFCYYFNGEPGRGSSFLWGRHFYMMFLIPLFFMFRHFKIPDKTLVLVIVSSVLVSFGDIGLDLLQGVNHREQGMNPNAFGPIQLCFTGILFFYFIKLPQSTLRWVALGGAIIGAVTVVLSLSRSTWITSIALGFLFTFYLQRAQPTWKKGVTAVVLLSLFSASYLIPLVKQRVDGISASVNSYFAISDHRNVKSLGTFGIRAELWKTGWKIFLENPLTGVGVGGFKVEAKANCGTLPGACHVVGRFKYAHNQYIAALATRGIPGLILFLLFLSIPIYIAMSHKVFEYEAEIARLSLLFICFNYAIGCLGEDHFEGKSAPMFVAVFCGTAAGQAQPQRNRPSGRQSHLNAGHVTAHEPKVSIIVPVFNVDPYLREGLESLLAQDFIHPCEVILIDDCSTDDSLAICHEFAGKHPCKIRLIESEVNGGVSVARNTGLEHARGCYLMFFDPDDILPVTALSEMVNSAEEYSADIVKGNLMLFNDAERRAAPDRVQRTELVSGGAVLTTLFEHVRVRGHIGGKLFRRDKFATLRFTVGVRMAQDLLFFSEMFASADSLVLLASDVYLYRKHPHGSTGGKYERSSYIDWMGAVEDSGKFASSPEQSRAHRSLLLRTMNQIARECRRIAPASAAPVLSVIEEKCEQWNIRLVDLLVRDKLPLRDISRYVKLRLALRQIRRNLNQQS